MDKIEEQISNNYYEAACRLADVFKRAGMKKAAVLYEIASEKEIEERQEIILFSEVT